jgi:hypothetical protein
MDKIWCFLTMPLGVLLCFGPIIAVWLYEEFKGGSSDKPDKH